MDIQFYTISEDMARAANDANSMSDYKQGSATEEYRKRVENVYAVVEKIKEKRPNLAEKAERMAGRYSKKLAEYYNSYYRNEASCPSVLISGAGNFPVKKEQAEQPQGFTYAGVEQPGILCKEDYKPAYNESADFIWGRTGH